ncbi:hypothetical protein [Halorarius halobius]|uniref:hypothetical protein n=1 Tax=Halorarius halobius TaxID=2962671 RepID=UPI0020CD8CAD|nr:hypothetical protein [Halorarius halobius]
MTANARTVAVTLVLACVVALSVVGPAAAADADERRNGTQGSVDATVEATDTDENSTLLVVQSVESGQGGGWMVVDCEGSLTSGQHACDKGGGLTAGPLGVDYEGNNYANPTGLYGGGGDEVTVSVQNRSATGEFDCTLRTDTLPAPCTVNGSSSEGPGVSLP